MMLGQRDILLLLTKLLNQHKIRYLLTGSFAVSSWGHPRATHDIDLVIDISQDSLKKLERVFDSLDASFTRNDAKHISASGLVTLYHINSSTKIDFWAGKREKFEREYKRRQMILMNRQPVSVISPEDLLLTKLAWIKEVPSERHLRDCIGIWKVQKGKFDLQYLHVRVKELGVQQLLQSVKKGEY